MAFYQSIVMIDQILTELIFELEQKSKSEQKIPKFDMKVDI